MIVLVVSSKRVGGGISYRGEAIRGDEFGEVGAVGTMFS